MPNTSTRNAGPATADVWLGDSVEELKRVEAASVDAVVTDPPYGLGYMGKGWDAEVPQLQVWREVLRVLKPGGHLLAFAAPRTAHRLGMALEMASFDIRDTIHWLYGSGYPSGCVKLPGGWSNRLATSHEPIFLCQRPFRTSLKKQFAEAGTGGLNIDSCRVPRHDREATWPLNTVIDDSVARYLGREARYFPTISPRLMDPYCPKPSTPEKEAGLDNFPTLPRDSTRKQGQPGGNNPSNRGAAPRKNNHVSVKPIELMQWLCRLVAPADGLVLDPFAGSGTTGCAAVLEGFRFLGIDQDEHYVRIAKARIAHWQRAGAKPPSRLEAA